MSVLPTHDSLRDGPSTTYTKGSCLPSPCGYQTTVLTKTVPISRKSISASTGGTGQPFGQVAAGRSPGKPTKLRATFGVSVMFVPVSPGMDRAFHFESRELDDENSSLSLLGCPALDRPHFLRVDDVGFVGVLYFVDRLLIRTVVFDFPCAGIRMDFGPAFFEDFPFTDAALD